jgi:SHS2 domain-containing protein
MGHYETFEHTADLGLRVWGDDLTDLFRTAASALFDVIAGDRDSIRDDTRVPVSLTADSREELLVEWLNDLIYRMETEHLLFRSFDVAVDDRRPLVLAGEIRGEAIDHNRHSLQQEVKAATRHGVKVEAVADGWMAEIILDI